MTTTLRAIARLREFGAPRVFSRRDIEEYLSAGGITLSESGYLRLVNSLAEAGCLRPVNRRIYLNQVASPPGFPDEAAQWLEAGAIISLQRVLGVHGILNNPSGFVTAVVPISPGGTQPGLGHRHTDAGTFVFRGIPVGILYAGEEEDRLEALNRPFPGRMPIATPEKALIDWIYLGASPRSKMHPPPIHDIDLETLDRERLDRLAKAAGPAVEAAVSAWMERADQHVHYDDREDDGPVPGL
ncbi:hypothetical protein [Acidiphilium multivorum]|uniref:hypothetical protein n=1 Tax=Acidiphilium multivorum TaxID=62140 RepID=UPI001F4C4609|nr:hypothetical protein [Acidiphilium multivorum]